MKHLSLFMLYTRGVVYKLILTVLAMAGVQIGLFYRAMTKAVTAFEAGVGTFPSLEDVISSSKIGYIFALAFIAVGIFLCRFGYGKDSRQDYLYSRLRVSEKAAFGWQTAAYALALFVFYAAEVLVMFALSRIYVSLAPEVMPTEQSAFLAFIKYELLHSLLPFEDFVKWTRNTVLCIALAVSYASFPYLARRGKFGAWAVVMELCTLIWFRAESYLYSVSDAVLIIISVTALVSVLISILNKGEEAEAYD